MPFSLQLKPIISDPEYLLDQHILISIKSSDSDESYGKGPGRGAVGPIPAIEATHVREGSDRCHKKNPSVAHPGPARGMVTRKSSCWPIGLPRGTHSPFHPWSLSRVGFHARCLKYYD